MKSNNKTVQNALNSVAKNRVDWNTAPYEKKYISLQNAMFLAQMGDKPATEKDVLAAGMKQAKVCGLGEADVKKAFAELKAKGRLKFVANNSSTPYSVKKLVRDAYKMTIETPPDELKKKWPNLFMSMGGKARADYIKRWGKEAEKAFSNAASCNAMSAASVKPGMKVKKVRGNYANEVGTVKSVEGDTVVVDLPGYRVPIYWSLDSIVATNAVPNAEPEVDAAVKTALATKLKAVSRALRDSYPIVHGQSAGTAKALIPAEFKALYDELIDPSYAQKIDALIKRLS